MTLDGGRAAGPRPLMIRAGGPLDGIITITAVADGDGRRRVIASWTQDGQTRWGSTEVDNPDAAEAVANAVADQLAAGLSPSFDRA